MYNKIQSLNHNVISCWLKIKELSDAVKEELKQKGKIVPGTRLTKFQNSIIEEHVQSIYICELENNVSDNGLIELSPDEIPVEEAIFDIHAYQLDGGEPQVGLIGTAGDDNEQPACNHWILPTVEFEGLWENLIYDSNIKDILLNYVNSIMFYSEHNVDKNIITWNRLVLLHGPPGTGKTSLCKALAQKLTVRLGNRFIHGELIEINSHSLFSKYFSESGKLVMQMFEKITEHVADEKALIFVLIDEVESLTLSRKNTFSGNDPSDSVRVVNTILTQLDKLKRYSNVIIFTTSNITGAIDSAFVDRVDIKQYIGLPSKEAIYSVYKTCVEELVRAGIIVSSDESKLVSVNRVKKGESDSTSSYFNSVNLFSISELSEGLSGRTLRKIPFLTHAHFIKTRVVDLKTFLDCLHKTVLKYKNEEICF
ncbi:pachytene checkpoint 2 protein isoform X2 [Lycorma delicatula]|uniref:pachytene checkpoint 2 protein isoform X2 n=1 Tax=Lycorma delicatula TaxID=130591 RepID=UPI003F515695